MLFVKISACSKLKRNGENRIWFRAFDPMFMSSPLGTTHTIAMPSRFYSGTLAASPFEILYLSENPNVCLREVGAIFGPFMNPIANPTSAWITINVTVILKQVADLTMVSEQNRLGITAQELTGDWEGYSTRGALCSITEPRGVAPTQELGQKLFATPGIEGFRTVSAKVPHQMNLVVFPSKLLK